MKRCDKQPATKLYFETTEGFTPAFTESKWSTAENMILLSYQTPEVHVYEYLMPYISFDLSPRKRYRFLMLCSCCKSPI